MATDNPPIKTVVILPHMYSFIFLNVSRLFTKTKLKYKVLSDLCGPSTLFLCLSETFLMDSIKIVKSRYLDFLLYGVTDC